MGWFFGCFGGKRKKDRKYRIPSSPLPKQQKPLYSEPICGPVAASSSIPVKAVPVQERQSHKDLFTMQQVSSSAPVRHTQAAFLQNMAIGSPTPARQESPGPWYQLDALEQELEDMRKQIDKESQDTKKIKEEVSFLKSHGTLVMTPSELKSPWKVDHQAGSVLEEGWRLWLSPSVSPNTRTPPVNNIQFEGLKAACVPTPLSSTRVTQGNVQHQSVEAQLHEEQFNQFKKGDICDTVHASLPCQDGIHYKSPHMNPSILCPSLDNDRILNKGEHFDNSLDGLLQKPKGILKQCNRSLCSTESSPCNAIENENNSTKKRRLAANVSSVQLSHALQKPVENDVGNGQDYDALCQKRLKVVSPVEQSRREINNPLSHADPVPVHFFRCGSLSPILESGMSIEECISCDNNGIPRGPAHQLHSYNSNNSSTQTSSLKQSPVSQTKSVTFASTNDEDYTTDEFSYNHGAVERLSEGSYTNSTCFNDTNDEDGSATASYCPSIDSEETLSDLSPEHCFSPPVSLSDARSTTIYRSQDNSASMHEKQAAKNHTIASQYSSVHGGRKKQHVSRYGSEDDDITEDDYDLFTDAMSHVSTECSEREQRRWHSCTESMDSVSAQFAQMGHATDLHSIDTPPKVSEWMATPNADIPGRAGKITGRLRSKPASSVLTPVENMSQWKQLKERDHKLNLVATAGSDESSKINPSKHAQRAGDSRPKIRNENKNSAWTPSNKAEDKQLASHEAPISVDVCLPRWGSASDAEPLNINASLSNRGITSSKTDSIHVDASFSQWGVIAKTEMELVHVDMSLSHWLKSSSKHYEAHNSLGTSSSTSSSGGSGVISPAPKLQTADYVSPNSVTRTQKSQYVASERPILGALGGDCPSGNPEQRSPWDGKGIPNSTAKYMEDKRVEWYSTPFEQRLEKALDKQGILLQKKLFTATTAAPSS